MPGEQAEKDGTFWSESNGSKTTWAWARPPWLMLILFALILIVLATAAVIEPKPVEPCNARSDTEHETHPGKHGTGRPQVE
jgi:hypothetical protein